MSQAPAAPPASRGRSKRAAFWKEVFWDFAHLAVLSAVALLQPIFNLLSKNPEFFAARGAPSGDVISFGIYAVLLPR
jgi:hypothetical protein